MCVTEETYTPPHTHIPHGHILYILHNLKTKPMKPSEFNNFFLDFLPPEINVWASAEFRAHSLLERELYKRFWAALVFSLPREGKLRTGHPFTQKQNNANKLPGKEQGTHHATTDFWAAQRSWILSSTRKHLGSPKRERSGSPKEHKHSPFAFVPSWLHSFS